MPDNEVKVIFTGVDNVSPVAKDVENALSGGALDDSEKTVTNVLTGDAALEDMRRQFEEAKKPISELRGEVEGLNDEFDTTAVEGPDAMTKVGIAATITAGIIAGIYQNLNDVVELSEDRPDLFTEEEIKNLSEYSDELQTFKDELQKFKIELAKATLPAAIGVLEQFNATDRARELAESSGESWNRLHVTQQQAYIQMALAEKNALDAAKEIGDSYTAGTETAIRKIEDIGLTLGNLPTEKTIVVNVVERYTSSGGTNARNNVANYGSTGRGATTGLSLDWLAQETNRRNTRH